MKNKTPAHRAQMLVIASVSVLALALAAIARPSDANNGFDIASDEAFWWIEPTTEHVATAWVGPNVLGNDGNIWRNWVMQYTVAGSSQPLVYMASLLRSEGSEIISIEGSDLSVQLQPNDDQTWRTVRSGADLQIQVRPARATR